MNKGWKETLSVRFISIGFTVLALAVFKPFPMGNWQWEPYLHLLAIWMLGVGICLITETVMAYVVRMPQTYDRGVSYIIHRNLWFQLINTPLQTLMICLYRHFVLSQHDEGNRLSWSNFLETLLIIAFCSFAIGLYWRFKYRNRYLKAEIEELQAMNERLAKEQAVAYHDGVSPVVTLTGSTSETVTLQIHELLYIEAVGNYEKVYQWHDNQLRCDMIRCTSRQIEKMLQDYPMIVRCHRAFLVNISQVDRVISTAGSMQLRMRNIHEAIPVSRSNMSQVKESITLEPPLRLE
ncbi:MAG: LytTR family transcriptional regulator DNA-binding domain-containing protein [Prevotella sp.]|nr:LytTR family transcriptional regulator DNA-binding domain-containing protein [Prevotella sp.]